MTIRLEPIQREGAVHRLDPTSLPEIAADVIPATVALYDSAGFEPPWIGYIAVTGSTPVGTCGFKSPPVDGRVEIAYFTFPDFEGRGLGTAMAAELVQIARRHDPAAVIAAQTLPARNPSHRVLEKLGFEHVSTLEHPEDGQVWEWQLPVQGA